MTLTEYLNQPDPRKLPVSTVKIEAAECQTYFLYNGLIGVHVPELYKRFNLRNDYIARSKYEFPNLETEAGQQSVFYLNFNPFNN